jgi:hypothetical protein
MRDKGYTIWPGYNLFYGTDSYIRCICDQVYNFGTKYFIYYIVIMEPILRRGISYG